MTKTIIFLDGDGTIWYPSSTKRTKKPHWIYHDPETKDSYLEHMELTPKIRETLEILSDNGVQLVLISANPASAEIAEPELLQKLEYFKIRQFFRSYHSSAGDNPRGKAEVILRVLQEMNIPKDQALMIGDSYFYDYEAAKDAGIDAYWIANDVSTRPEDFPQDLQSIDEVADVLEILS